MSERKIDSVGSGNNVSFETGWLQGFSCLRPIKLICLSRDLEQDPDWAAVRHSRFLLADLTCDVWSRDHTLERAL